MEGSRRHHLLPRLQHRHRLRRGSPRDKPMLMSIQIGAWRSTLWHYSLKILIALSMMSLTCQL